MAVKRQEELRGQDGTAMAVNASGGVAWSRRPSLTCRWSKIPHNHTLRVAVLQP
jgi:hypothetical protein